MPQAKAVEVATCHQCRENGNPLPQSAGFSKSRPVRLREAVRGLSTAGAFAFLLSGSLLIGQAQQPGLPADDLPASFKAPALASDFDKRVVMIPMRDGVKLYTVIVAQRRPRARRLCSLVHLTTLLCAPHGQRAHA